MYIFIYLPIAIYQSFYHSISEANGRVVHRKGFAETYSTNIVEGAGTFVEPRTFRGMVGQ